MSLLARNVVLLVLTVTLMAQSLFADPPANVAAKSPAELEALIQGKESSPEELKAVADELEKAHPVIRGGH